MISLQVESIRIPKAVKWMFEGKELENHELLKRLYFVYLALLMGMGALMWGVLSLIFDRSEASVVPFGYVVFTVFNLYMCKNSKNHKLHCNLQIFLSILLPFLFQFMLGGVAASGCVMLWSLVALVGALSFQSRTNTIVWFVFLLLLTISSVYLEHVRFPSKDLHALLLGLNVSLVTFIMFYLSRVFIDSQFLMRKLLNRGNELVLQQNKQIHRSLQSAKSIQQNILPSNDVLARAFENHFVFSRPKDLVSGDFHWFGKYAGKSILACIDCTGHGVPGAFMSMMGYNLMNQIVYKELKLDPADILTFLNHSIRQSLKQDETDNTAGMDMSILVYDEATKTVEFAGAKSDIYLLKGDKVDLIRGTRRSIGGHQSVYDQEFDSQRIKVERGDRIIMMTDGLLDQFGGPDDRRRRRKNLIKWMSEHNSEFGMRRFGGAFEQEHLQWMGDNDQVDDILVVGVEF